MPPFDWKPSRLSPQPHWKTATSTPYAAPTESRLSTIAFTAITIERNETSSSRNANTSTKPNTIGAFCFSSAFSSADCGRGAGDGVGRRRTTLPIVAGRISLRSVVERRVRHGVGALADERDRRPGRRCAPVDLDVDRAVHPAVAIACDFSSAIACCVCGESMFGLDRDDRAARRSPFENAFWIFLIVPTVGALFGSASSPLCAVWRCSTGSAIDEQHAAGRWPRRSPGWRSTGVRIAFQNRFSPSVAAEPVQERDLALLDLVAEPRQQRRQHRERAEHRDADDHHRGDAEAEVGLVAGEHHPGHRDHHRDAGDQHRAARGRGGGLERGARASAGRPLLTLALE